MILLCPLDEPEPTFSASKASGSLHLDPEHCLQRNMDSYKIIKEASARYSLVTPLRGFSATLVDLDAAWKTATITTLAFEARDLCIINMSWNTKRYCQLYIQEPAVTAKMAQWKMAPDTLSRRNAYDKRISLSTTSIRQETFGNRTQFWPISIAVLSSTL